MKKKVDPKPRKDLTRPQEINVIIHHADSGPALQSCMVSILAAHMSRNADF